MGELLGGTLKTQEFAIALGKPLLLIQTDNNATQLAEMVNRIGQWLDDHSIATLNIAGPRESKRPGTYRATWDILEAFGQRGKQRLSLAFICEDRSP